MNIFRSFANFSILVLFIWAVQAPAAVWTHDSGKKWDLSWQKKYSSWIKTSLKGDTIHSWGPAFKKLKLDCADAHYALMAYFSRMHGLPFAVAKGKTTNLTNRFDHISDPDLRLAAFVDFLRAHYGTEALSHHDTFPPAVADIQPGDIFMWKIGSSGNYTRHTYIIKKINPNGTFNVMYSTQANAANRGPLKLKTNFLPPYHPKNKGADLNFWGFRRAKMAHLAATPQDNHPGSSFEQYKWALSMSKFDFFNKVQNTLRTKADIPSETLENMFDGLCETAQDRIKIVSDAIEYATQTGNKCMNFADYDAHSTPARDKGLMDQYWSLEQQFLSYENKGQLTGVPDELVDLIVAIFDPNLSQPDKDVLYSYCPIEYASGNKTELNTFRTALFAGNVSFHPNDNLFWRWGVPQGSRTKCKEYYGYPD